MTAERRERAPSHQPLPAIAALCATLALCASAACRSGVQSALDPRGPQAEYIWYLWVLFLVVSTGVFVAVAVAVFLALFRRDRREIADVPPEGEPTKTRVVAGATILTVIILLVLLVSSVYVGSVTTRMPGAEREAITVAVVGHQWWWEFQYLDEIASRSFTTANEMRVPVGRPVIIHVTSRDVIHSFWVPNLHGKIDLVPGKTNTIWFQADEPGEYRGQCAEFCGLQHAKMAFVVVAEPPEQYDAWAEAYRRPAAEPVAGEALRGRDVFLEAQCSLCHTIRGTGAWGRIAPDLTRIGSRRTLAAGTLPNTRGNMGGWLLDPQQIKPGSFMPPTNLAPDDLHALLTYLESLK